MKHIKIVLLLLLLALVLNSGEVLADGTSLKKIKVKVDSLDPDKKVKVGDLPIGLSDKLLQKLFPELKNPRQIIPKDLKDQNDLFYLFTEGLVFVLKGDFNNDGIADVVFSGKYLANDNQEKSFVAVISFPPGQFVEREFLQVFSGGALTLNRCYHYKPGIDGIYIFGSLGSEDIYILYWNGSHYKLEQAPGAEEFYVPRK